MYFAAVCSSPLIATDFSNDNLDQSQIVLDRIFWLLLVLRDRANAADRTAGKLSANVHHRRKAHPQKESIHKVKRLTPTKFQLRSPGYPPPPPPPEPQVKSFSNPHAISRYTTTPPIVLLPGAKWVLTVPEHLSRDSRIWIRLCIPRESENNDSRSQQTAHRHRLR